MIDFMNANFQRTISVTELAGVVNLSTSYFSRIFKKEIGVPPVEYL